MKKFLSIALIMLMITLPGCAGSAPAVEQLTPRLGELIEASYEINEIFFGGGLPTYPRVDKLTDRPLEYDEATGSYYLYFTDETYGDMLMYYDRESFEYKFYRIFPAGSDSHGVDDYVAEDGRVFTPMADYVEPEVEYVYTDDDVDNYDVVRVDCGFTSIAELKAAAEAVYTAEFLEQVYQGAFDGVAYAEDGYSGVRSARFIEQDMLLRQYNELEARTLTRRIYDLDTARVVRPSSAERVNIEVETYLEGETERMTVTLVLIFEDGDWYLDTPTY